MEETDRLVQNIAKNIRALRMSKQLTQKEIAESIGVHKNQYARIENAQIQASVIAIVKIAEFFEVSVDKVVMGKDVSVSNFTPKKKTLPEKLKELEGVSKKDKQLVCDVIDLLIVQDTLIGLEERDK